jgi:hypothetical protein
MIAVQILGHAYDPVEVAARGGLSAPTLGLALCLLHDVLDQDGFIAMRLIARASGLEEKGNSAVFG